MAARAAGRRVLLDGQIGFRGGLNTTADESQLRRDELRRADNARLTEYGGLTKRLGSQRTHASALVAATAIKGGFTWRKTTPATHFAVCSGKLLHAAHGAYPLSWTDEGAAFDPGALVSFASFRDSTRDAVYIADGAALNKYTTLGLSLNLSGTPNVSRIAVHNQRLFGCGDPANPETIYFSALQNGDSLGQAGAGGGSGIVRTFGHEPLTALLAVGQSLLMFHDRGVSRFTGWGQDDFNIAAGTRGVTQDVGTIAPNSVVAVENVGFFLSDRGAYQITESGVLQISAKIEKVFAETPVTDLQQASAVHNRASREVWFFLPNRGVLVFNYRLGAWSGPFTGIYETADPCLFWESGAGATPQVMFGGGDGFVRQADVPALYLDDVLADGSGGMAYTMTAQLHRMFFGDPASEKALRFLYVTANLRGSDGAALTWKMGTESGAQTLSRAGTNAYWGAAGGSGFAWGNFTWGVGGSVTDRVQAHGRGRYADVQVVDSGESNPVFSRVEAHAFDLGRRY